jgi:hypothetical protein
MEIMCQLHFIAPIHLHSRMENTVHGGMNVGNTLVLVRDTAKSSVQ